MELVIAFLSLIVSLFAFGFSYYSFRRTQKVSIMPVLVFSRIRTETWQIKNVGQGVAMSIIFSLKDSDGKWGTQISFYPIASNGIVELPFMIKSEIPVVSYKDIKGNEYSSICELSENQFYEINKFPELKPYIDEQSYRDMREQYRL